MTTGAPIVTAAGVSRHYAIPGGAFRNVLVLKAVDGGPHIGVTPSGASGCPIGEKIPGAVCAVIRSADAAAAERLASITVADLLANAATLP